jgi:hypothetical protein
VSLHPRLRPAQLISNNWNHARNGNLATGDQGLKLPHFRERRPRSARSTSKNPANGGPFSTVSVKCENSGLDGGHDRGTTSKQDQ